MPQPLAGPQFEAPGLGGMLTATFARVALALAGVAATPLSHLLSPRRYRAFERGLLRLAWRVLGAHTTLEGREHAEGGPFVVMALHESLVDPLLLAELPLDLRFVARDEIGTWPHVGPLLDAGRHLIVPLRPSVADLRDLLVDARAAIDAGESLVVFPQGSVLGVEIAFQRGAFWLARQLDVPVLPVAITGTHRAWEYPFSPRIRRGVPVRMTVLRPFPNGDREAQRALERRMRMLALLEEHAPARRFVPERDGYWDDYPYEVAPEFEVLAIRLAAHRAHVDAGELIRG
jgi:1-acyl-sn-glycerol-3-phosphate acyltransferase